MNLARFNLALTDHAYDAYCQRVGKVSRADITAECQRDLHDGDYYRKKRFMKIAGAWWVYEFKDDTILLITCYGVTHLDLPSALKWARDKHDGLNLDA